MEPGTPEPVQVVDYSTAMRSMIDRAYIDSRKYGDQQRRADRIGAHPDILEFEKRLVTRFRKQLIPLFALCVNRGEHDQNQAYVQGHSKAKWGESAHNYGMAVDVIHCVKAYNLERKAWDLIGHYGKEISVQAGIPIVWGGDWKFYDPAHWELANWKQLVGDQLLSSARKGTLNLG